MLVLVSGSHDHVLTFTRVVNVLGVQNLQDFLLVVLRFSRVKWLGSISICGEPTHALLMAGLPCVAEFCNTFQHGTLSSNGRHKGANLETRSYWNKPS